MKTKRNIIFAVFTIIAIVLMVAITFIHPEASLFTMAGIGAVASKTSLFPQKEKIKNSKKNNPEENTAIFEKIVALVEHAFSSIMKLNKKTGKKTEPCNSLGYAQIEKVITAYCELNNLVKPEQEEILTALNKAGYPTSSAISSKTNKPYSRIYRDEQAFQTANVSMELLEFMNTLD